MRAAIVSTKGGTGKTTSAAYLALALHRLGRTMLVDADPQLSAITWKEQAEPGWPLSLPVVSIPTRNVHRTLLDLSADYDHVVVDSPPGDLGIIRSVIMSVQLVIVVPEHVEPQRMGAAREQVLQDTVDVIAAHVEHAEVRRVRHRERALAGEGCEVVEPERVEIGGRRHPTNDLKSQ